MATYGQAIEFLEGFIDYERHRGRMKYGTRALHIRRFARFLDAIGAPHRAAPVVHVAGTMGKGSTAAILHSIAVEAGLRSGLYTSPHLESYCERIRIDREPVSKRRLARAVDSLRRRLERDGVRLESGYRTTFELLTTVAFEVFRDEGVDLAIVETGLGGRLDATNVVRPEVAAITAIGMEHTHLLGTTFRAIAREKAGIVKPGRPVVVGRQVPGAYRAVLEAVGAVCRRRASRLIYAPRRIALVGREERTADQTVRCAVRPGGREIACRLPLLGRHQAENLRSALAVVEVLRSRGWAISDRAIARGARRTVWPGRCEWLPGRPPLLLDGAHCPQAVEALVQTLRDHWPGRRPIFLLSLLDDKPVAATVEPLARAYGGCTVVAFRPPSVRGRPVADLVAALRTLGLAVVRTRGANEAVARAANLAGPGGLLAAFGTLYSVEALRKAHRGLTASRPEA